MRLFYTVIALLLSACAPTQKLHWSKVGATQSDLRHDQTECQVAVARDVPFLRKSVPLSRPTTNCVRGFLGNIDCTTNPGLSIETDENESLRERAYLVCMERRGWRQSAIKNSHISGQQLKIGNFSEEIRPLISKPIHEINQGAKTESVELIFKSSPIGALVYKGEEVLGRTPFKHTFHITEDAAKIGYTRDNDIKAVWPDGEASSGITYLTQGGPHVYTFTRSSSSSSNDSNNFPSVPKERETNVELDSSWRNSDPESRLKTIEDLRAKGLLSEREYEEKRKEIIEEL